MLLCPVVVYLMRKDWLEKQEEKAHAFEEEEKKAHDLKTHVVGSKWRAMRGDARMREEADLTSSVVAGAIAEGELLEMIDGPVMVGQHERIKIRTNGVTATEGWVTPDARPHGPVFFETESDPLDVWL